MKHFEGHTGMIIPDEDLENSTALTLSSSAVTVGKHNTVSYSATNFKDQATFFKKKQTSSTFPTSLSARREGINSNRTKISGT